MRFQHGGCAAENRTGSLPAPRFEHDYRFDLAGLGVVGAEVEVATVEGDDGLARSSMFTVLGQ